MRATIIAAAVVSALVLTFLVAGAIALYVQFRPNTRLFLVDNITLRARLDGGAVVYQSVVVGNPGQPYDGTLDLSFRCGSTEIHLDRMSVSELRSLASSVVSVEPRRRPVNWSSDAQRLLFCDGMAHVAIRVIVSEDQVLAMQMRMSGTECHEVQLRTARSVAWVSAPIADDEAVRLFGPPDHVGNVFEH